MIATQIIPDSKENPTSEGKSMEEFCKKIFPNLAENKDDRDWLYGRAILATTNKEVAMLNDIISSKLPGTASVFRSADELLWYIVLNNSDSYKTRKSKLSNCKY